MSGILFRFVITLRCDFLIFRLRREKEKSSFSFTAVPKTAVGRKMERTIREGGSHFSVSDRHRRSRRGTMYHKNNNFKTYMGMDLLQ
ncbi:MAG: hypothetical protein ACI8RD_005381 [Bacillariaceae sp.]|jgi:hypothetical protein